MTKKQPTKICFRFKWSVVPANRFRYIHTWTCDFQLQIALEMQNTYRFQYELCVRWLFTQFVFIFPFSLIFDRDLFFFCDFLLCSLVCEENMCADRFNFIIIFVYLKCRERLSSLQYGFELIPSNWYVTSDEFCASARHHTQLYTTIPNGMYTLTNTHTRPICCKKKSEKYLIWQSDS